MRIFESSPRRLLRGFIVSFVLLVMISVGMVSAQDDAESAADACDIDLSGAIATLVQAQAAASSGETEEAQSLIADAQAALDAITTCEGGGREAVSFDFTQTYDYLAERAFSFDYPEGWLAAEDEDRANEVSIATTQELIEAEFFYQSQPGAVSAGDYVGIVALETSREFGLADQTGLTTTALEFGQTISAQLLTLPGVERAEAVEELELATGEAVLVTIYGQGYVFVIVLQQVDEAAFDEGVDEPETLFLFTALAGSPDDIATVRQTAISITESAVYTPAETE